MSKRWRLSLIAAIAAILLGSTAYIVVKRIETKPLTPTFKLQTKAEQTTPGAKTAALKIDHIFVIMEENQPASLIIGNNANAPYLNNLMNKYAVATNYFGVAHPSLPNYLAVTSGSTDGITTDCNPPSAGCIVNVKNIADEIESSGRTWKEYAESMPAACYAYNSGNYATKHNPFVYYEDIVDNNNRCQAHVVPYDELSSDLKSVDTTPDYAFITPNLCNDMHNCSIDAGDYWLSQNVPPILNSKAFTTQNSLLIITWDEGNSSNNQVAAIIAGSAAKLSYTSNEFFNHYSILSTIESVWHLAPLTTNDQNATPLTSFLRQ